MAVVPVLVNTNEPVALKLPIVLVLVVATPLLIKIPMNGELVLDPTEVTPVKLMLAMVLVEIVDEVLPVIPLKRIPVKLPVEPVSV